MTRPENPFPAIGQVPGEMSVTDEDLPGPPAPAGPGSQRGTKPAIKVKARPSKIKAHASCGFCGHSAGRLKVYRDPFGTAIAPGRWPNLTMHSDCFLTYIRARKAAVRELTS